MPNIPSIKIGNTTYNVKDTTAREHLVEVSTTQPSSPDNRLWIKDAENEYEIPTYEEFSALQSEVAQKAVLPVYPSTDGTYILKAIISNGTAVLSWEAQS